MQTDELQLVPPAPIIVFLIQSSEELVVLKAGGLALLRQLLELSCKLSLVACKLLSKVVEHHLLFQLPFQTTPRRTLLGAASAAAQRTLQGLLVQQTATEVGLGLAAGWARCAAAAGVLGLAAAVQLAGAARLAKAAEADQLLGLCGVGKCCPAGGG